MNKLQRQSIKPKKDFEKDKTIKKYLEGRGRKAGGECRRRRRNEKGEEMEKDKEEDKKMKEEKEKENKRREDING